MLVNILFILFLLLFLLKIIINAHSPYRKFRRNPLKEDIIYTDIATKNKNESIIYSEVLYSPKFDISGKPDYILKTKDGSLIPVELKSAIIPENQNYPFLKDVMQLTAYFILVEERFGSKPKKGRIVYKNCVFEVKNTIRLRSELLELLSEMRSILKTGKLPAYEVNYVYCRNCVYKGYICEFSD